MRDYTDHEVWLRSLEVDDAGNVLSSGFPKFFNYGERPEHNDKLLKAAVWNARPKYDGTLIIATNGRCRTRGQLDLGSFEEAVREAGWPSGRPGVSELYELLGPASRQVVDYGPTHRLVKLAEVDLATMTLTLCVEPVAQSANVSEFLEQVRTAGLDLGEGFVVDVNDYLVKVKSDSYRKAHAFKSDVTRPRTWRLLAEHGCTNRAQALDILYAMGYDFESSVSASAWVDEYLIARYMTLCKFGNLLRDLPATSRKDAALFVQDFDPRYMGPAMAALAGNWQRVDQMLACIVLDESFGTAPNVRLCGDYNEASR